MVVEFNPIGYLSFTVTLLCQSHLRPSLSRYTTYNLKMGKILLQALKQTFLLPLVIKSIEV